MKNKKLLVAALILVGNIGVSTVASAEDGIVSEDALSAGSYGNEKFPAIEGTSLPTHDPVLKRAESGDIIDFYGPCNENITGKSLTRGLPHRAKKLSRQPSNKIYLLGSV